MTKDWAMIWAIEYWELLDGLTHEYDRRVHIENLANDLRNSFMPIEPKGDECLPPITGPSGLT